MVDLFQSSKANVSEHIKHIFEERELDKNSVVRKFRTTAPDGKNYDIEHYNLDMIISLGYRSKSSIATRFRQWATARLLGYIVKGFTMDDERLKNLGGGNYWKELLDRIRDIRSSDKVLYRQVLDLYSTSIDYDAKSAETIYSRIDAEKDFMGLTIFAGEIPIKSETKIAKNYLKEDELFRLNRMVSAFFDLAEIKAREHIQLNHPIL
ncbi:MAG: virulence RhuM family protein [Candidatus Omnitrophica bacterium]|nr:virulence RhuM family protein [Candidatus Omnitrophota bacterium]